MRGIHDGFITSVSLSRKYLATGSTDKSIKIYEFR